MTKKPTTPAGRAGARTRLIQPARLIVSSSRASDSPAVTSVFRCILYAPVIRTTGFCVLHSSLHLAHRQAAGHLSYRFRQPGRPGVGPYAAAHIMMTLGRYHRLILDSWTQA